MNEARIRIGVDASTCIGLPVGIEVYVGNLVRELAQNWDLVAYASEPALFAGLNAQVRVIPGWTRTHKGRIFWQQLFLPRFLRRDKIDLLLVPFSELPLCLSKPSIAVVHDITPLMVSGSTSIRYAALFRLVLHTLRNATAIVTDSQHTRADLQRSGILPGKRILVIYGGTDFPGSGAASSSAGVPEVHRYLLYVGGFLPSKNIPLLVEAFNDLKNEIPHHLILVGWAHEHVITELRARISQFGLQDRVILKSGIARSELVGLYGGCDLFVYPSCYEGFGLPVLEAMACGAPVLCSNAASIPEVGGDAVMYFSPDSKTELVAGIRRLLGDAELRREMSRKGRARAQLFTWSRTADAFSSLINQLLRPKVPGSTDPAGQHRTQSCGQDSGI